jgi:hypothetical protein
MKRNITMIIPEAKNHFLPDIPNLKISVEGTILGTGLLE